MLSNILLRLYANYSKTTSKTLHPNIPIILFTKGGGQVLEAMADTGCDAWSIDWTCDLARRVNV